MGTTQRGKKRSPSHSALKVADSAHLMLFEFHDLQEGDLQIVCLLLFPFQHLRQHRQLRLKVGHGILQAGPTTSFSYCTPDTAHPAPHSPPHTAHPTQHTPHSTPHTARPTQPAPHSTPHTAHPHSTPHTAHPTQHTPHCSRHTAHPTLLSIPRASNWPLPAPCSSSEVWTVVLVDRPYCSTEQRCVCMRAHVLCVVCVVCCVCCVCVCVCTSVVCVCTCVVCVCTCVVCVVLCCV